MAIHLEFEPFVPKKQITLRLDPEIIEFYRSTGPRWQGRINQDLAQLLAARRKAGVAPAPKSRRRGSR
jgi:uncharacterized protein (DUF4415 family)